MAEDPLSADKRTLAVAALAMVVMIAVGAVSAALFTGSACDALEPSARETAGLQRDVADTLAGQLGLGQEDAVAVVDALDSVAGADAELLGAVAVGDADRLAHAHGALAALGPDATLLGDGQVSAAVSYEEPGTLVGDGTPFAVAQVNDETGQIDALAPVDEDLQPGACVDTATVGTPLAFHLDAADGRLLTLRMSDEAENPEIELRGPGGPEWTTPVAVGAGPPGTVAARHDGAIGDELVVSARRAVSGERGPVVTGVERADGEVRFETSQATLAAEAPAGDRPLWPEVVAVTEQAVVVSVSREDEDGERGPHRLVGLDPSSGEVAWSSSLSLSEAPTAGRLTDAGLLVAAPDGDSQQLARIDLGDGSEEVLHVASGQRVRLALEAGSLWAAVDAGLIRVPLGEGEPASLQAPLLVRDVEATGGRLVVLLAVEDRAVAVWLDP